MIQLRVRGMALTLGTFFAVTFALCVGWGLLLPSLHARGSQTLEALLPGFVWLTPASFLLGLVEAFLFGAYAALVFVPLFNYFDPARRLQGRPEPVYPVAAESRVVAGR
jgi:hypothetical protein